MSDETFLEAYLRSFDRIEGWFSPDAALMFMAYASVLADHGLSGSVLEIGVHQGLSAIAVAAIRGEGAEFVAVDLFDELQAHNVSASGRGNRSRFERNLTAFFGDTGFIRCIASPSAAIEPAELGVRFSFCHVDGGHSVGETSSDLELCAAVLRPGGLLALDDYFNPSHPGVCEGAMRFRWAHPDVLVPVAVGFNKVLLQKQPAPFDLHDAFERCLAGIPHRIVRFWETPARLYSAFAAFIDIRASSPRRLVASNAVRMDAELRTETSELTARLGDGTIHVPVHVVNRSMVPFRSGTVEAPFGLSYHLMAGDGRELRFDNVRSYFDSPIAPGDARTVALAVDVPETEGSYQVELDIVWEGMMWLKSCGLHAPRIRLTVI
jgi:hypothetical protein